ncbi:hypothetical protein PHSY_006734 [Pseudozyma hubeiensis SY62]|uniref:Uncharacterized protein n=1 Tax=Pseudozyma hubeiensis (strain SY62) TaxID=1305764 RepID=R9PLX8_PSEHS|nr:hypothetical protein PHSY_006734 [Pseudozyma hubeiensis SY62]GAC99135.1 hypothetical protein PHSY_006734 [Pseudozyma hubeiensis SY62]
MADDDVGDVDLLEWSHELDRSHLRFAFRPLRSTVDRERSAPFLYKLARSSKRKQVGFLLLDCDACTAFYEGVSLRTLDRRTRLGQPQDGASDLDADEVRLAAITKAIHHALDPHRALDTTLKTSIGLESTRFSSSLSISVKSRNDASDCDLKTSFDLDPLDHAALANVLSSHFVRPLLRLAAVLSRSASQQQLDGIQQKNDSALSATISGDSLELLRRAALTQAHLPIGPLQPLLIHGQDNQGVQSSPSRAPSISTSDESDDDLTSDMLFFGPPGLKAPYPHNGIRQPLRATTSNEELLSSPSPNGDLEDGDRTFTERFHSQNGAYATSSNTTIDGTRGNTAAAVPEDDSSDTSEEEESLPIASKAERTPSSRQPSSSPQRTDRQASAKHQILNEITDVSKRKSDLDEPERSPEDTPPPPSFAPTSSQTSPSRDSALRNEQRRRREQIAMIKRGQAKEESRPTPHSSASSGAASKSASTTRKRARF